MPSKGDGGIIGNVGGAACAGLFFGGTGLCCFVVSALHFWLSTFSRQFGMLDEMLLLILRLGVAFVLLVLSWFFCVFSAKYAILVMRRTRPTP